MEKKLKHAKYIFVQRLEKVGILYTIGIVDNDFNYYQKELSIFSTTYSYKCFARLGRLFNDFIIDADTRIFFLETINKNEIVYTYFYILKRHFIKNVQIVRLEHIIKVILRFHGAAIRYQRRNKNKLTINSLDYLWKKALEHNFCPWITNEINMQIQLMPKIKQKKQIINRLALYYMVVNHHLSLQNAKN